MKRLHIKLCVLCVLVAVCTSGGLAESIIDESFDALAGIPQAIEPLIVNTALADTWFYLPQDFPIWDAGMGMAMIDSSMSPMDMYTTLVYFSAKPAGGWGAIGAPLEFSFMYSSSLPELLQVGVYGWAAGAEIFSGPDPGLDGAPLMMLPPLDLSPVMIPMSDVVGTDLSGFDFIGATFTMAGSPSDVGIVFLDDVQLNVVPEPASMLLVATSFTALAGLRRRRRRQRGKT